MNHNSNFEEELKKSVKLLADYRVLLDYALNKVQVANLLFSIITLDLSQRKNNYISLIPLIEQLKEKFKQLVFIKNKLASLKGFPNNLEFYLTKSGIPREKYNYFLKNLDRFVSIVHEDFPLTETVQKLEEQGVKEWTELNVPYAEGYMGFSTPFSGPNDIIDIISKYDQIFKKNKERIRVVEGDNKLFNKTIYLPKEDIVEIQIGKNFDYKTEHSLRFVNLLGVALEMLKYADRGEDPNHLPVYLLAYEADKFTFNFVKTQAPEKTQKVFRYDLLRTITFALFAIDIFTNDQQDFDIAFAKAVNKCYLKAHQSKNPFYVFMDITSLMEDLMHSINYVEFYLEYTNTTSASKNI